jgi:serine/threonine protein kinase/WD40 repeat protein
VPSEGSEDICVACFLVEVGLVEDGQMFSDFGLPGIMIRGEIARGGVGIVYRGQQMVPQRQIAIKVLQPQWARNQTIRSRFRREAQTMVALEHPAILPVYEVGENDGLPWFTMKLATGGSLAEQITHYRGQWRRSAELIATLAKALDFAHRRGVLHRDVKPANVLFDAEGRMFLADFGIAKEVEMPGSTHTLLSDVLGTPHYLSPEVAAGGMEKATTANDVYGLGVILYELLSGEKPHRAKNLPALLRQIVVAQPKPLAGVLPRPPSDLIEICTRAMEKEPGDRYSTAGGLAEDLRRFLDGKQTVARPLNWPEASWRWSRSHPASALLACSVVLLLATLGISSNIAAWRLKRAHESTEVHWREDLLSQAASIRLARAPGFRDRALELVREAGSPKESEAFHLKRRSEVMCALAFPTVSELPMPAPPARGMQFATASARWKFLAWHDPEQGSWQVTRVDDGALIFAGRSPGLPQFLSADGRWLATQEGDKLWKLWRMDASLGSASFAGDGVAQDISEDGRWFACHAAGEGDHRLAQIRETAGGRIAMSVEYPNVALSMRFSPDGQFCAVAPSFYLNDSNVPYTVRIYRSADGTLVRELALTLGNCVGCMTWSPDGRWLLAAERDGPVYIWDVETGDRRHILRGPGTQLWQAAFSQDRQKLATISEDGLVTAFCLVSGRSLAQGMGSQLFSRGFQWQSDESFGPVAIEGKASLFRYQSGAYCGYESTDTRGGVLGIAASPDGRWTALGDARHAWLWDHECRQARPSFANGLWNAFCFSPDGRQLYGAGEGGVKRWAMGADGAGDGTLLSPPGNHSAIAVDRSGQLLAIDRAQNRSACILRQPDTEQPERLELDLSLGLPAGAWIDLSPDGRFLAIGGREGFNVLSVDDRRQLYADKRVVRGVRFSPDARWLLVAFDHYEIWSTETWKCERILDSAGFSELAAEAAFHPKKPLLAAACSVGRIGIWSTNDWHLLGVLENPSEIPVRRMSFDANGTKLRFGSMAGIFATWDFTLLEEELTKRGLGW